ncbi:MAG: FAD binding domain-containing protein [Chloracidobacterium sp.]|nr:FAD binding domain-containing protein [Chloracidobacterium sp.]
MIQFVLNNETISTDLPAGTTVLDFVRYHKNLKGTKIGCREGDCGACTILVGEFVNSEVKYRTMTSCLMPIANASGKHIVTVEGINPTDRGLTPVQQAMIDESGTQCGFCTVGFVMSLTGFCIDDTAKTPEMAVSAIDGNICRCTGYKSIEKAACSVNKQIAEGGRQFVPDYFADIAARLKGLISSAPPSSIRTSHSFVGGGTDLYVQRHDEMTESAAAHLLYNESLRGIRDTGKYIEIGASATVTDLLVSPVMQSIFPDLYKHLKLVSSTPIRNMATLAGNFVNASPIGDMTVWFLALDAEIDLCTSPHVSKDSTRTLPLKDLYLGYKQLAKQDDEILTTIRFKKPSRDFRFNFEKVCKRTYLDIATVNTAISILSEPPAVAGGLTRVGEAHVVAGGVAPIPLYLRETSAFLRGKEVNAETVRQANEIMQSEISPISDVRGTEPYKRLLLRQLFRAHFMEMFN